MADSTGAVPTSEPPERDFDDLVGVGVRTLDAFLDYLGSILKLQGFRFARTTVRSVAVSLAAYASAGVFVLGGVVLVTLGAVHSVGSAMGSVAGGFFVVGGVYALLGGAGMLLLGLRARRARAGEEGMESEHDLEEAVQRARVRLITHTNELTACLREALDPMRSVRRNPLGGIFASMAAGMILGARPPLLARREAPRNGAPPATGLASLLWSSLPILGPIVKEVAMRWASGRRGRQGW